MSLQYIVPTDEYYLFPIISKENHYPSTTNSKNALGYCAGQFSGFVLNINCSKLVALSYESSTFDQQLVAFIFVRLISWMLPLVGRNPFNRMVNANLVCRLMCSNKASSVSKLNTITCVSSLVNIQLVSIYYAPLLPTQ